MQKSGRSSAPMSQTTLIITWALRLSFRSPYTSQTSPTASASELLVESSCMLFLRSDPSTGNCRRAELTMSFWAP